MGVALMPYVFEKWPLFVAARELVRDGGVVVDVGPGIRPQTLVQGERAIYVEPHGEYADALANAGHEVLRQTGNAALAGMDPVDTIVALDVIEHMEKADGLRFLDLAQQKASQIVVFTPLGFLHQPEEGATDAWGLHGQEWQKHRSGWRPEEFKGWQTLVDSGFHAERRAGAFFAVWQK
jgi:hypothetical protein